MKRPGTIEELATKYNLSSEFVASLAKRLTDLADLGEAVRMFYQGTLAYSVAIGDGEIDLPAIRRILAKNRLKEREFAWAKRAESQRALDWYASCQHLRLKTKQGEEVVYIRDGMIVAFSHIDSRTQGIYAADNPIHKGLNWHPHAYLGRLRKMNKPFYRSVKKAAHASPKAWFDFSQKTYICNDKKHKARHPKTEGA